VQQALTSELIHHCLYVRGRERLDGFRRVFEGATVEPDDREQQRKQFFEKLFHPGDGFIDLRAIRKGSPTRQEFITVGDWDALESFITENADRDLYFGVAARFRKGGRLEDCGHIRALFVDLDFKNCRDSRGDIHDSWIWAALEAFPYPADIIVRSGGGLHCYWVLKTPIHLETEAPAFKKKLRSFAKAVGGDKGSAEPAHILRIPGTLNWKYRQPLREVTLVRI